MSRLVVRNGVFGDRELGTLGADSVVPQDLAAKLDERTTMILRRLDEDARNRRFALMIAGASALFAALKLGIIALPHLRSRVGRM